MSNYRWALIEWYVLDNQLQANVIEEDFKTIQDAEAARTYQLNLAPIEYTCAEPQNMQVIQYVR